MLNCPQMNARCMRGSQLCSPHATTQSHVALMNLQQKQKKNVGSAYTESWMLFKMFCLLLKNRAQKNTRGLAQIRFTVLSPAYDARHS